VCELPHHVRVLGDEQVCGAEALTEGHEPFNDLALAISRHVNSRLRERQQSQSQSSCLMLGAV
jgi:hypothetical protein